MQQDKCVSWNQPKIAACEDEELSYARIVSRSKSSRSAADGLVLTYNRGSLV